MQTKPLKKCKHCGKEANSIDDLSLFVKDKNKHLGVRNRCKACQVKLNWLNRNIGKTEEDYEEYLNRRHYRECRECGLLAKTFEEQNILFARKGDGFLNMCKACHNKIKWIQYNNASEDDYIQFKKYKEVLQGCLRKCTHCGLEAHSEEDLDNFITNRGKLNLCKPCGKKKEWLRQNPDKNESDYYTYLSPPYLRKCTHCGLEAHSEEDLTLFVTSPNMNFNKKNQCKACSNKINWIQYNNSTEDDYYKYLNRIKPVRKCGSCGLEVFDEVLASIHFGKTLHVCKICRNAYGRVFGSRRRKNERLTKDKVYEDTKYSTSLYKQAQYLQELTGIAYEVDHIFPINNPYLCGFNSANNLQILEKEINNNKNNKLGYLWQFNVTSLYKELGQRPPRRKVFDALGSNLTYDEFLDYERIHYKEYIEDE